MGAIEETFNFALGEALPQVDPKWSRNASIHVETTGLIFGENLRPDILVNDPTTPPVVIENSYDPRDADKDACSRLGLQLKKTGRTIETSIAVFIPKRFRKLDLIETRMALLEGEEISYAIHQYLRKGESYKHYRWVERGFIEGSACDLARLVSSASIPKESAARIANEIASHLEQAAMILEEMLTPDEQIAVTRTVRQVTNMKGLRTASVLWLNAFIVQQRLVNLGVPQSEHVSAAQQQPLPSEILSIWNRILDRNWHSIFHPAMESMKHVAIMNSSAASEAISHIIRGVEKIFVHGWEVLFNVGAELFPRLSDDRKQAAAFYTQPATAELLASLTIRKNDFNSGEWAREAFPSKYRIADLACGTGTLLRAGYQRIRRFHEECSESPDSSRNFHRHSMEHGLVGMDVSPIAAHLASSTLAIQGYGDAYSQTQIGWCEVGGERHATGSIELFNEHTMKDLLGDIGHAVHGRQVPSTAQNSISVNDNSITYILMNPPYSRTRKGQSAFDIAGLSDEERENCQEKWGELISNESANKLSGMAATFLALASKKLTLGGRMGFVLPLTAAFAKSWQETRAMIENEFEDIIAVAVSGGKALGAEAFSADTGMEEMLLVCRRKSDKQVLIEREILKGDWTKKSPNSEASKVAPSIYCVTLRQPPQRLGESGEIGKAILRSFDSLRMSSQANQQPICLGESELGHVCRLETQGKGVPWGVLGSNSPDLAFASISIQRGVIDFANQQCRIKIPMCTIEDLFEVGPTHHSIGSKPGSSSPSGVFEIYPIIGAADSIGKDRLMWGADATNQKSLLVNSTHKGIPKGDSTHEGLNSIRQTSSTLFYSRNMRWTSQKVLSSVTQHQNLGGRSWLSLQHEDNRVQSAFCLWSNSTLGMLVHWSIGQRTQTGRSTTQVNAIRAIPCPDFRQLSADKLTLASKLLISVQSNPLLPACQAHTDKVRCQVDDAVIEVLDLPDNVKTAIDQLRFLWCNEPSVHGNNRKALKLLEKD